MYRIYVKEKRGRPQVAVTSTTGLPLIAQVGLRFIANLFRRLDLLHDLSRLRDKGFGKPAMCPRQEPCLTQLPSYALNSRSPIITCPN